MGTLDAVRRRVEGAADWYDSRRDFDQYLIKFSWYKIRERARGESVLELGSADGMMTEDLVKNFRRVVVVEGAAKNCESIRAQFPSVEVHHCLFEEFQSGERFDNVIMARALEHLDDPVGLLKCAVDWLAPGGRIHVVVPNAESLNRKLGLAMGLIDRLDELTERDHAAGHVRVYRRDLLVSHIRAAGLDIVELTGTYLKPLSNSQMIEWKPELIWGFFELSDELPQYCTEIYAVCERRAEPTPSPDAGGPDVVAKSQ
jgi:2-polyprenyl-3-methyl-5-hydroxy-6-metoxy-1,4-benzoquinol methylase